MDQKRCIALALIWSLILGACAPAEVTPPAPEPGSLLEEEGIPQDLAEIRVLSETVNPDT